MSKQKSLHGSKTEKNLMEAFAGESQATNKYTYYASQAKKDGYVEISNIFAETAGNEREHAKLWFKYLHGGKVPATLANLKDAAAGEHCEWTQMYKRMAKEAHEEGFYDIERLFKGVAEIEHRHESRYIALQKKIENKKVFAGAKAKAWICLNCGAVITSQIAPKKCPVCSHPQSYFKPFEEKF